MYGNYQDRNGFFHHKVNPVENTSENPSIFTAGPRAIMKFNGTSTNTLKKPKYHSLKKNDNQFYTHAFGPVVRCSHDNMTGLYIARELEEHDMDLPIIRWDDHKNGRDRKYWLHPRDIIFYMSLDKSPFISFLGSLISPLLWLFSIVSYLSPFGDTSGKCMWLYRYITYTISNNYFKKFVGYVGLLLGLIFMFPLYGFRPFTEAFSIYFKDESHPANVELRKIKFL